VKTFVQAQEVTPAQLRHMHPPQVDEYFEAAWEERYARTARLMRAWDQVFYAAGARRRSGNSWDMYLSAVQEKAKAAEPGSRLAVTMRSVTSIQAEIDSLDHTVLAKLDNEYERRPWLRAHLAITNGKGHIHRSMRCSTCNKGESPTRFHWMIDWSGKTEEEIIEAAGTDACTVCFRDAPVARGEKAPDRTMFAAFEVEAAKARQERAAAKAKRDADKEAKAIYAGDGGPLTVWTWTQKAHQKRSRGRLVDVPEREFSDTLKTLHAARGWLTDRYDRDAGQHRDLHKVADAVALKEGKTRAAVLTEAKERARRRR
jgi:hypothetical protein